MGQVDVTGQVVAAEPFYGSCGTRGVVSVFAWLTWLLVLCGGSFTSLWDDTAS